MSKNLSALESDILESISDAYAEDPSPESGRTYVDGEEDDEFEGEFRYKAAMDLKRKGLLRVVESGKFDDGSKYIHFGLTDKGFKQVG